ncbi:helix-turn-helix domain-containing protein [Myxosarcina sp. GI1]|uniref:helix-turn-helix domain-containing protein n=1 Tax=Myxosarcina sp. GI1 TaxID=1541065 RepID=UPI00056A4CDC|nr:helix-turn-helix domain-containing protein [Myxosarcina sp. GI1]
MSQTLYEKNQQLLNTLIKQANIEDLLELSKLSGVSQWQLNRLQHGLIVKMSVENIAALARTLNLSIEQLIDTFISYDGESISAKSSGEEATTIANLKREYASLQEQMQQQREVLKREFQQDSLQAIESWLLQWPTAAAAVRKNSQLPAERLLPLVKPIEQLLDEWGIETIAAVGEKLPYDPQWHQLLKGTANSGQLVEVRYVGYKQGDKLLYKAKVSPIEE